MKTKAELRAARKAARAAGQPLTGDLRLVARGAECDDRGDEPISWSESAHGWAARDRWARHYDSLNGAPESDYDR